MRLYRLLLCLLPGWFREEFGGEMAAVFAATRADATTAAARAGLWMATIRDVAALAGRLHWEALSQDAAYAVRTLRRTPAFTIAAIGTLALGLGPTVVIANFLHQVIVAPLPLREPDRLVRIWNARPERRASRVPLSVPDYVDYRSGQQAFAALAAHTGTSVALTGRGEPRQITGVLTTSDLHEVLGRHAMLGRDLTPADSAAGAPAVMLLGPALWRTEFGGRGDVIGQSVRIDGAPTTIVGVLSDGFDFPPGSNSYWVPLTIDPANANRGSHYLTSTGRLRPGVTRAQAQDALNGVALAIADRFPDTSRGLTTEVFDLKAQINGDSPRLLGVLGGAIAAVLLIACLNVASLLTVRASVRGSELAVRTALGATGRRLRRPLLVEHVVLAIAGGGLAAAAGVALHRLVIGQRLLELPRTAATFGWPAFAVLVALVLGIGAAFAWIAGRRGDAGSPAGLLTMSRHTGGPGLVRAREVLVAAEVAAALVLLVTAGLMAQSASRLAAVDPGFRTEGVLTFGVVLPGSDYGDASKRAQFAARVVDGLKALPGVRQAAAGAYAPMGEMRATRRYAAADQPPPEAGQEPVGLDLPVGPGYFEVMGIRLVDGRTFADRDAADGPPVMVVSEQLARTLFPNQRAVGQRIRFYSGRPGGTPPPTREIVGVVRDVRQDGVATPPIPQMYSPYAQTSWGFLSFFVEAAGDPALLGPVVQQVVSRVDPMRPARDVRTIDTILRASTERQRALTWMLTALAATALLLATVGLYGVGATAAAARSRELAIRAAIGANPRRLVRLVVGHGLGAAAAGVVLGIGVSLAATQALASLLFEVPPRDPWTLGLVATMLLAVAALAALGPARRTVSLNLADVLRRE